jgi:hypothetical protein
VPNFETNPTGGFTDSDHLAVISHRALEAIADKLEIGDDVNTPPHVGDSRNVQ